MRIGLSILGLIWLIMPHTVGAILPSSPQASDSGFASNTVIDIIEHNGAIWLATTRGVNITSDQGATWTLLQNNDGMVSTSVSAMHSQNGRVWISTSHSEVIGGESVTISDGLFYSTDDGESWTQIPFGPEGLNIPYILGGFQTIFDITGHHDPLQNEDWLFFGAWAGGLVASQDNGDNWRRIYSSVADSIQYNDINQMPWLGNLYFSAVTDTSHGDTLTLWGGTAAGLVQYSFAPPREKLFANNIFAVAPCDLCTDSAENFVYYGTDRGVSRTLLTGGPYITRTTDDGLPGSSVRAMIDFRDHLFVASVDSSDGLPSGLAVSTDFGESFTYFSLPDIEGDTAREVTGFASIGERLYLSGEAAGLFVSSDTGLTWERILVDSAAPGSGLNEAFSLEAIGDTLFVGTDSGLVRMDLAADGSIDSLVHFEFVEDIWSAGRLTSVAVNHFKDSTGLVDSVIIWTVNEPADILVGTFSLGRNRLLSMDSIDTLAVGPPLVTDTISVPYLVQETFFQDSSFNRVEFWGDTLFVGGVNGLWTNSVPSDSLIGYLPDISITLVDAASSVVLENDTILAIHGERERLIIGTSSAAALTRDSTFSFRIRVGKVDSLSADTVKPHTYLGSFYEDSIGLRPGLSGDFVQALAVQYLSDSTARIWASGNRSRDGFGFQGISFRSYETDLDTLTGDTIGAGLHWRVAYDQGFAWNYAFSGDTLVFAASTAGLLVNRYDPAGPWNWLSWDTITIISDSGLTILGEDVSVYSVAVVGDDLWVGTSEGTIRRNLVDTTDQELFIVVDRETDASEVYAYPVPFSPGREELLHFRFVLEVGSDVTIEIYDFAMNLVARPIENVFFEAGYHENPTSQRLTWDGRNGLGDLVAVGVYYFKVISSSGTRWGKLGVMP